MSDKMSLYASQLPSTGGSSSEFVQVINLKRDAPNPIRLVDTPNGVERYYISWIMCDDGTRRPFIIENDWEGKGILAEILGDRQNFYRGGILESIQDPVTKKGKLIWEDKDPELLMLIAYNNDTSGRGGSWKPKEEYIFNAIQRNPDIDDSGRITYWCKENKHTKVLKMGISAFKHLQDVRLNDGNPSEYDINYLVKGSGMSTQHNIMKAGANVPNVVIGPLTSEEESYQRYGLRQLSALTSSTKILQYLRDTIQRIDNLLGTSYIQRLEEKAAKEGFSGTVSVPSSHSASTTTTVTTPTPPRVPVRGGTGSAQAAQVEKVPCGFCGVMIPKNSEICPACKNTLMEPCVNPQCGKKFSVFDSVCPHCGQEYQVG